MSFISKSTIIRNPVKIQKVPYTFKGVSVIIKYELRATIDKAIQFAIVPRHTPFSGQISDIYTQAKGPNEIAYPKTKAPIAS
jgi:hypothetical protein